MAKTVFESTNMLSTRGAKRIFDAVINEDIENGTVGYLTDLASGYTNVYTFVKGKKKGETPVIVDQPVLNNDTSSMVNQRRDGFVVKAGTPFRVRVIAPHDEFSVSKHGFTSGSSAHLDTTDAVVTVDASGKLVAAAKGTNVDTEEFVGVIRRKKFVSGSVVAGGVTYGNTAALYQIEVIKSIG